MIDYYRGKVMRVRIPYEGWVPGYNPAAGTEVIVLERILFQKKSFQVKVAVFIPFKDSGGEELVGDERYEYTILYYHPEQLEETDLPDRWIDLDQNDYIRFGGEVCPKCGGKVAKPDLEWLPGGGVIGYTHCLGEPMHVWTESYDLTGFVMDGEEVE